MSSKFASGKHAFGYCDRCGFRAKLSRLRELTIKTKQVNIRVCKQCWEADHPQLQIGMYPISDPQAIRNARPDQSLGPGGSRAIVWGWNPVMGCGSIGEVGTVTVTVA